MSKRSPLLCLLLVALAAHSATSPKPTAANPNFDGKSWWEHIKVLAADDMEGRETGSEGLRKAAAYIVNQLKKDGLQPAGINGFYQPVKLISRQIDESASSLTLVRNGASEPLTLGEEAFFRHASEACARSRRPDGVRWIRPARTGKKL